MTATLQKWGNSRGIRIPKFLLDEMGWSDDEKIVLRAEKNTLIIEKEQAPKTIEDLFADFTGEYEKSNIDWGSPVGKEIW